MFNSKLKERVAQLEAQLERSKKETEKVRRVREITVTFKDKSVKTVTGIDLGICDGDNSQRIKIEDEENKIVLSVNKPWESISSRYI